MPLAGLADDYNRVEPFIWYAVALLAIPALRGRSPLRERLLLAATLVAFGTSDFYESVAWWTPWWLLAWKAACLIALAVLIHRIWRRSLPTDNSNAKGVN